jgi:hypothetical protein
MLIFQHYDEFAPNRCNIAGGMTPTPGFAVARRGLKGELAKDPPTEAAPRKAASESARLWQSSPR